MPFLSLALGLMGRVPLKAWLVAAVVALLASGGLWLRWDAVRDERAAQAARDAAVAAETRRRAEDADVSVGDPAADWEWLRRRGGK